MPTARTGDDAAITYRREGAGRPLVLVHGITERSASWDPLVAPLTAAGFEVVRVDLRGHGESSRTAPYDLGTMAGDVGAVIADAGLDDPVLVGHSLGGAVVSAYAAAAPCAGVINVDQPLALARFKDTLGQLEPLLRGDDASFQQAISMVFDEMAGPLAGSERERIDGLRQAEQDVVLGIWELVLTAPAADLDAVTESVASSISVPYLSLHGIDPGDDYAAWLRGLIPTATVEVWADQGHYPHLIDPDRFVERVTAFAT